MSWVRTNPPRWPYSLQQLREDEPSFSFSSSPSEAELAYFEVFLVQPTVPPAPPDPDFQRVVEVWPVMFQDGTWRQQWEIVQLTPDEQIERYRETHPPRWVEFADSLTSNPAIAQLYAESPDLLDHSLTGGLIQAVNTADFRTFASAWAKARAVGLVPAELLAAVQALAVEHDLPAEFVESLA